MDATNGRRFLESGGAAKPQAAGRRLALRRALQSICRRPWLVASLLAVASLAISVLLSLAHWPTPQVQDEFSNLLIADTFCEGRLANPTHPHWQHFESFHIIQQPTYASKYPPGQGAFYAIGQWLTGEPVVGLWIMSALAVVGCYWMLLGWTSPGWALLGGVILVVHPGYQLAWGQLFWGGTLAALGGALVFGAALRIVWRCTVRDAVAMATGTVLLAFTRPFEGLIFCLLTGGWVLVRWARGGLPATWRTLAMKTVLPQAAILLAGGFALATYNRAVTGDPLTLPYSVHEQAYAQTPLFLGQAPATKTYRHDAIARFHSGWSMDWYRMQDSLAGVLTTKWEMTRIAAWFFIPWLFAIPLLLLLLRPCLWLKGRAAPSLAIGGATFLISLVAIWNFPHYIAPLAPLILLAIVAALRYADALGRRFFGPFPYAVAIVGCQACLFMAQAVDRAMEPAGGWNIQRAETIKKLEKSPQRHLIFVRYGPDHKTVDEWVYNRANIDGAKVVWAREMDPASDRELMRYFADRKAWLLEPDTQRMLPLARDTAEVGSRASTF